MKNVQSAINNYYYANIIRIHNPYKKKTFPYFRFPDEGRAFRC